MECKHDQYLHANGTCFIGNCRCTQFVHNTIGGIKFKVKLNQREYPLGRVVV